MKLILIRHGETDINIHDRIHTYHDDTPLNAKGIQQAHTLISVCIMHAVQAIFTSPVARANQTAEIIAQSLIIPLRKKEELQERNWGDFSGQSWSEVKKILDTMDIEQRYTYRPPNGETWHEMDQRLEKCMTEIIYTTYTSIAVVTHKGVLRALVPLLLRESKKTSFHYDFDNGSASVFNYENGKFTLEVLNSTAHLKA